jgi:glutamate synthase (NADPH) small chain
MGKPTGFKEFPRETPQRRPVEMRVLDWKEIYLDFPVDKLRKQAARCMDCGVPFCNHGCPLGNQIPDWNDLVYRDAWREAIDALLKTNNFPEFTGRICPAPCEEACVLNINDKPVTIKLIEQSIIDKAFQEGWIQPAPPEKRTGKKVAVVGSGPGGLAAADQLNKAGHFVTVFERDNRPGGLLIYGIPDFKMDKSVVDRRIKIMEAEGVTFRCRVNVGRDVSLASLRNDFDAIVLATGATRARGVNAPGNDLRGVHLAMTYLPQPTYENLGDEVFAEQRIDAKGKNVVIIGGGDTAADCLGTALRQGAKSVKQFDINARPPSEFNPATPWPNWQMIMRSSAAHEEGSGVHGAEVRDWGILTKEFLADDNGNVRAIQCVRIESKKDEHGVRHMTEIAGSAFEILADLVLVAIGFSGPEPEGAIEQLGLTLDARGNVAVAENYRTSVDGVFACGDCRRGQSLVVWAISEGRGAARGVDEFLMGRSDLPAMQLL